MQENAEILKAIAVATLGVGAIASKGVGQVVNLMRANRLAVATNALPQATSRGFAAASRMVTNSFDNVLGGALTTVKTPIPRLTLGESTPAFLRRAVELITAKGGNNADFLRLLQNPTVTGSNATIDAFISLGQTQRFTAALRRRTERDRPGADTRGGDTMTLRVAADPARWMYIPARFPWQGYTRVEEWSAALLAALDDLHDYDTDQRGLIRAYAEGLSRSIDTGEHRYAYLTQPHVETAIASFYEWPHLDVDDAELQGARDVRAVRPAVTEPFHSAALGDGTLTLRHVADATSGTVSAVAHWVRRMPDRDIIMIVGDSDLPRFLRLRPLYDDLARAIDLVPGDEGRSSIWPTD